MKHVDVHELVGRKARFAIVDELGLMVVDNDARLSDEEWVRMFAESVALTEATGARSGATLYVSDVAMSATARRMTSDFVREKKIQSGPLAVVTSSLVLRGSVTAFNWLTNGRSRAFAPERVDDAIKWLATVCRFDAERARSVVNQMTRRAAA